MDTRDATYQAHILLLKGAVKLLKECKPIVSKVDRELFEEIKAVTESIEVQLRNSPRIDWNG